MNLVKDFQKILDKIATKQFREWSEKYMRHHEHFRGVKLPKAKKALDRWYKIHKLHLKPVAFQEKLAFDFLKEKYTEDKLTGVLILQHYLYKKIPYKKLLRKIKATFNKKQISYWNTCDWFCIRVLARMIDHYGENCAKEIASWHNAPYLWTARASVVPFVNAARRDVRYHGLILKSCKTLIKRKERFAKTAVGWMLRDISRVNKKTVTDFIKKYDRYFSVEARNNATKYLS